MPFFILDSISDEISLLKLKLAKADSYVQRTRIKAQLKDKQEYYNKCLVTQDDFESEFDSVNQRLPI